MPEIGSTWVAVAPSARGFGKELNAQVGREISLSGIGKTFANTIGKAGKVAFAAVGTAGVAALTNIVRTGVSFNASMQQYDAKFQTLTRSADGLTHSSNELLGAIQRIKLTSPFSKSEIASAASTLLQFGISAENVEDRLRRLGDASGGNAHSFQWLATIYGRVQETGRLMGGQINQLISYGFNPFRAVAHVTGQTVEEVRKEFENTTDQAAWLSRALELATDEGGQFHGMMQTMNNTLKGSMGNLKDTFQVFSGEFVGGMNGRIMQALAGFNQSIEKGIKSLLSISRETGLYVIESKGLTNAIGLVADGIDRIGTSIGDFVATSGRGFLDFLDRIDFNRLTDGLARTKGLLVPLGGVAAGFIGTLGSGIPVIGPMFQKLTGPVGIVLALFIKMWQESEVLREAVGNLFGVLSGALTSLAPVTEILSDLIASLAGTFGDILGAVIETIVIPLLQALVDNVFPALLPVIEQAAELVGDLASEFADHLAAALDGFMPLLLQLVNELLVPLLPLVGEIIAAVAGLASEFGGHLAGALHELVPPLAEMALQLLPPLLELVRELLPVVTELASGALVWLVDGFVDAGHAVTTALPVVLALMAAFKGFKIVVGLINGVMALFKGGLLATTTAQKTTAAGSKLLGKGFKVFAAGIKALGVGTGAAIKAVGAGVAASIKTISIAVGAGLKALAAAATVAAPGLTILTASLAKLSIPLLKVSAAVLVLGAGVLAMGAAVLVAAMGFEKMAPPIVAMAPTLPLVAAGLAGIAVSAPLAAVGLASTGAAGLTLAAGLVALNIPLGRSARDFERVAASVSGMGSELRSTTKSVVADFTRMTRQAADMTRDLERGFRAIPGVVKTSVGQMTAAFSQALNQMLTASRQFTTQSTQAFTQTMNQKRQLVQAGMMAIAQTMHTVFAQIVALIRQSWSLAEGETNAAWARMRAATSNGTGSVVAVTRSLPGQISGSLGNLSGLLFGQGQQVVNGLINGMNSRLAAVRATANQIRAAAAVRSAPLVPGPGAPITLPGQLEPTALGLDFQAQAATLQDTVGRIVRATSLAVRPTMAYDDDYAGAGEMARLAEEARMREYLDYLADRIAEKAELISAGIVSVSARHQAVARVPLHESRFGWNH